MFSVMVPSCNDGSANLQDTNDLVEEVEARLQQKWQEHDAGLQELSGMRPLNFESGLALTWTVH